MDDRVLTFSCFLTFVFVSHFLHTFYSSRPSHPTWFYQPNNICSKVQIIKLLIRRSSSGLCSWSTVNIPWNIIPTSVTSCVSNARHKMNGVQHAVYNEVRRRESTFLEVPDSGALRFYRMLSVARCIVHTAGLCLPIHSSYTPFSSPSSCPPFSDDEFLFVRVTRREIIIGSKYFTGNCTHNFVPLIFAVESCAHNVWIHQTALFYSNWWQTFAARLKKRIHTGY